MRNIVERLTNYGRLVDYARAMVEADWGSSPALNALMKEFEKKSNKALKGVKDADEHRVREYIVEVEQAADSAKVAAEADPGVSDDTREAVRDAHISFCVLKSDLSQKSPARL
jgi:hypothetical protein